MTSHERLSDLLPWWDFVAPGVVLNTDGSLQATMTLDGPDLRWQPPHIQAAMMGQVNNALRQLEPGSILQSETQRSPMLLPATLLTWNHPTAALIDEEDRTRLTREPLFESVHYVTLAFSPPSLTQRWGTAWMRNERVSREPAWKTFLPAFQSTFQYLVHLLQRIMVGVHPLDDTETYRYLDFCMNMRHRPLQLPKDTHYLARQLDDESFEGGDRILRGDRAIRAVTITAYPPMTVALMLSRLDELGIAYRWTERWKPYEALQADRHLAQAQKAHAFHQRPFFIRWLDSWFGESPGHDDPMAMLDSSDVSDARVDVRSGDQIIGDETVTVVVWADTPSEADRQALAVKTLFAMMGFTAALETTNLLSAFLGSMPGVPDWNPKAPTLESINASHMMAIDGVWSGFSHDAHWQTPPLFIGKTAKTNPYRIVPHAAEHAAAHLVGFGSNGSGKTAFLSRLRMGCQGVPGLRDYGLDFKMDNRTTTLMLHGTFTDLGKDRIALQPFRRIHEKDQHDWAQSFLESCMQDLRQPVTIDGVRFIGASLDRLAKVEPSGRTWRGLKTVMAESMVPSGPALHFQNASDLAQIRNTQREILGMMTEFEGGILDGAAEFRLAPVHTFELETLFENMRKARPVMRVVHHLIDQEINGDPMLLWADEWQALLDDHESEEVFKYRLQRLRSKNVMLSVFLHEPGVIFDHPIGRTLVNNCTNKIFFPNLLALSPKNQEVYEAFDLTERQIHQLADHPPRTGFLWKSEGGTRFVEYLFEPFTLAVCGRSGKRWHQEVDRVLAEVGPDLFPAAWAERQGFPEQATVLKAWVESRRTPLAAD